MSEKTALTPYLRLLKNDATPRSYVVLGAFTILVGWMIANEISSSTTATSANQASGRHRIRPTTDDSRPGVCLFSPRATYRWPSANATAAGWRRTRSRSSWSRC